MMKQIIVLLMRYMQNKIIDQGFCVEPYLLFNVKMRQALIDLCDRFKNERPRHLLMSNKIFDNMQRRVQ